jgi:hypothetical protein
MMTWTRVLTFLARAALMVAVFFSLSVWHLSIVTDASQRKVNPYPLVLAVTNFLPSPGLEIVAVPINLFFVWGIWAGAVVAFAVAFLWRTDTAVQLIGPAIFALISLPMFSHGYGATWLPVIEDLATVFVVFFVATIPFTILGRKIRRWADSRAKTSTTVQRD